MSLRKIKKKTMADDAAQRIPRAWNWIRVSMDGRPQFFNLDRVLFVSTVRGDLKRSIAVNFESGAQALIEGAGAENFRAHLMLISTDIDGAAKFLKQFEDDQVDAGELEDDQVDAGELEDDQVDAISFEDHLQRVVASSGDRWSCPHGLAVANNCTYFPRCHVCEFDGGPVAEVPLGPIRIYIDLDAPDSELKSLPEWFREKLFSISRAAVADGYVECLTWKAAEARLGTPVPPFYCGEPLFGGVVTIRQIEPEKTNVVG